MAVLVAYLEVNLKVNTSCIHVSTKSGDAKTRSRYQVFLEKLNEHVNTLSAFADHGPMVPRRWTLEP